VHCFTVVEFPAHVQRILCAKASCALVDIAVKSRIAMKWTVALIPSVARVVASASLAGSVIQENAKMTVPVCTADLRRICRSTAGHVTMDGGVTLESAGTIVGV